MKKRGRIAAGLLAASVLYSAGVQNIQALNADDVLNDNTNALQRSIIDYILVKNYLSGNISLNENFAKTLDINHDGTVNVLDSARLKQTIIELSAEQKIPEVTTVSETTAETEKVTSASETTTATEKVTSASEITTVTETVTTVPVTTSAYSLKKGDYVSYSGDAHYTASGNGKAVNVSGIFVIADILADSTMPYTVQLEHTGWVAYKDLEGKNQPSVTTTAPVTTTSVTTTASSAVSSVTTTAAITTTTVVTVTGEIKKGDYVSYSGDAHYTASGNGTSVPVSGIFKVAEILTESVHPYTVQLEHTGWVSYKALTGKDQPVVTPPKNEFDGNTYKIKNAASGKYLTVSGTDDRSNICQAAAADNSSQLFKAASYYSSSSYRLYALSSDSGKVIDIVKNGEEITSGCNIQLYESVDPDAQIWKIEDAGNGKFRILSAKNSRVALTANGTADGTSDGKKPDSAGNVYLSEYKGSENQLWILEKK